MLTYRDYLAFAEKYLLLAEEKSKTLEDTNWLLFPATILAWSAIESFINNMLDDFGSLPESMFQFHERAFLLETRIKFIDRGNELGRFALDGTEYRRLEDKIGFLIAKFGQARQRVRKGDTLWQDFEDFKETRDRLIHPRRDKEVSLDIRKARKYISTSKKIIQFVSQHVWKKKVEF
jgi:hypothetical protein